MKKIFTFIVIICITSCAGWRSYIDLNAKRYDAVRNSFGERSEKSLLLSITAEHRGPNKANIKDRTKDFEQLAIKFFQESGLFSSVGTEMEHFDLELVINIIEEEHFGQLSVCCTGESLLIIPTVDRVTTECTGMIYDNTGEELGGIKVLEEIKVMISLIFFPFIPSFFIASSRADKDIWQSVLTQIMKNEKIWASENL